MASGIENKKRHGHSPPSLLLLSSYLPLLPREKTKTRNQKIQDHAKMRTKSAGSCWLLSAITAITANNGFPDFRFPPAPGSGPFGDFYFVPSFCPRQSAVGSATAGNLSYDCARGRHLTVSAAASRRHVDASLDLFARKKHVDGEI